MGCVRSLRDPGLRRGGVDCDSGGRPTYFRGGEVATQSLPYFSRVSPAPAVGEAVRGGRVGGVSSFDECRYLIRTVVREGGRLYGAKEKGRASCCGRVTVFALGSAGPRGQSHCWGPEEQGL